MLLHDRNAFELPPAPITHLADKLAAGRIDIVTARGTNGHNIARIDQHLPEARHDTTVRPGVIGLRERVKWNEVDGPVEEIFI